MGWQLTVGLNVLITVAYALIASNIVVGLVRTRQLRTNALAVATAAIFLSCGLHHGEHAMHVYLGAGVLVDGVDPVKHVFGEPHAVAVDVLGAVVAIVYHGLRRSYSTLLKTPAMFEDSVRAATEQALRRMAFTDSLTGLGNRAAYDAAADAVAGTGERVALVCLDLDGFKSVNDTFGHDAGDRVLAEMGRRFLDRLEEGDKAFRLGGDEFVVMRRDCGPVEGVMLLHRCLAAVALPLTLREGELVCRASAGLATGPVHVGLEEHLRRADLAMYERKAGRIRPRLERVELTVPAGPAEAVPAPRSAADRRTTSS